jgi:hypothetical protein
MIYKVHWIIDGVAEIDAKSKEEAEKILRETLEDYVKNSDKLMNKFVAKSIQGTAYIPGTDDADIKKNGKKTEKVEKTDEDNS